MTAKWRKFIRGIGTLAELHPRTRRRSYHFGSFASDRMKLRGDWQAVGGDISQGMSRHREDRDKGQMELFGDSR